jgi:DNA-binding transcriptional MerR regulator
MIDEQTYTIQEMAQVTGLSDHTLRYYERIGLIDPVERAGSGHRRYDVNALNRVQFLNRMRATGMSIRQMQHYTELLRQGESTIGERREMLETHRCRVLEQLHELQECLAIIETKIANYYQLEQNLK